MDLTALKLKRKQIRRLFTKACNEFEELSKDTNVSRNDQLKNLKVIEDKANRLFEIDNQVSDQICLNKDGQSSDDLEEIIAQEYDMCEEYRDKWLALKIIYDDLSARPNTTLNVNESTNSSIQNIDSSNKLRLPKLQLKPFDGNIRNWIGFWGQFHKIHEDSNLEPEDKFQYLIQATVPNSSARELVESYPPSKENYSKAIETLKARFARDELLVEVYVRDLLSLVLEKASKNNYLPLSKLYDKLVTQLNALESLGVTSQKYAAMLFPLVESALPEDTLRAWERHRTSYRPELRNISDTENTSSLSFLLQFLKAEVESEERLNLARSGFSDVGITNPVPRKLNQVKLHDQRSMCQPTAATILATSYKNKNRDNIGLCLFCSKPHCTTDCAVIVDWSFDKKRDQLRKSGGCFICLKHGHSSKTCRTYVKCILCKRRHHTIMCGNLNNDEMVAKNEKCVGLPKPNEPINESSVMLSQWSGQCYLQTLVVNVTSSSGTKVPVRALVDSGSQRCYISKKCINELGLIKVGEEIVTHTLFGGVQLNHLKHNVYDIVLGNLNNNFELKLSAMDQDKICNFIPRLEDRSIYEHLSRENIVLTDMDYDLDVELLLGADIISKLLTPELMVLGEGLVAVNTKLGWTVMGQHDTVSSSRARNSFCCTNLNSLEISQLWRLDVLGITDPAEVKAQLHLEKEAMDHFKNTVSLDKEGRYTVQLPWIEGHPKLLGNKEVSVKRLNSTTKRLVNLGRLENYSNVINEWEELGIVEKVDNDNNAGYFIPHHPVIKDDSSTTKVRPVFDASAKDMNGNSLNDCLVKGSNFVEEIHNLIIKFRKNEFGVSSDIAKAFLQINVQQNDKEFLKFLWWKTNECEEICTYRHCRVVFGLKSSPFLLGAVINHLLESAPPSLKNTADKLKESFYVDNCITSVNSKNELDIFIKESKILMSMGKFDLRSWVCSGDGLDGNENTMAPLLGLIWDSKNDRLSCNIKSTSEQTSPLTKRVLLSIAQSVFDPIGFTCPISVVPKLLLQETWKLKVGWDTPLPDSVTEPFHQWRKQIYLLNDCFIPRKLSSISVLIGDCTLHVFSDASKFAYAACVFLRVQLGQNISVQLVTAKSRIAPCKEVTIPRLELLGAVIASRLHKHVETSLQLNCKTYFWVDSSVVLAWIKRKDDWNTFVANRCKEIRENTNPDDWHHIPGQDNPADLPSRGCTVKVLCKEKWWEGPRWLYKDKKEWPKSNCETPESEVIKEKKRTIVTAANICENTVLTKFENISCYTKIIRTTGWIFRFIENCHKNMPKRTGELTAEEIQHAETKLLKMVQKDVFTSRNESKSLKKLQIFEDKDGLLRIKSRLLLGSEKNEFKYPIVLPPSHVVRQLIRYHHILNQHVGVQILLHILREEFWILGGRKTIKSVLSQCLQCKRLNAKPLEVPFAPLPPDRIKMSKVFEVVGIDLAGPLFLKSNEKAWIVLYTCAVYRAVHLELIKSLTTDAFLQALRRFIARRGRPSIIYSDNGTNFTGASNAFNKLNWDNISRHTSIQKIIWKFNPPSAPWWGGWWERLIGILKNLLRRTLGRSSLYYEELNTVLCDCEAVLNNRPLTYVSSDTDDLIPLSPSSYLQSIVSNEVIEIDKIDKSSLNRRWRYIQKLREELRARFRKEYLGMLVNYGSPKAQKIHVGDVVLVGVDNAKRISWPIGLVVKVYPGKDSITRLVRLKMTNGEIVRPVQRLYPLEITAQSFIPGETVEEEHFLGEIRPEPPVCEEIDSQSVPVQKTRLGRPVKPPNRLDI